MTLRQSSSRVSGAVVATALAIVIGAQAAMAATPISETGKRGKWILVDSEAQPAATCVYDEPGTGNDLDVVEAKSPRVLARDRSAARDGQWVGIRIVFQRSVNDGGSGGWQKVAQTPLIKKFAYDDKAVSIGRRSWQAEYTGMPHFRVLATMRWYRPGTTSTVQGATTVRYQWYATSGGNPEMDRCLPEF
jgi:hypothetical protein